jgi:hypothetical protein
MANLFPIIDADAMSSKPNAPGIISTNAIASIVLDYTPRPMIRCAGTGSWKIKSLASVS